MSSCRIVGIVNQKGGVGKTTTAVNLGAALALEGKKTLLVDMDPQGSLTLHCGIVVEPGRPVLADVMRTIMRREPGPESSTDTDFSEYIEPISDNLHLLPTNIMLSVIEAELPTSFMRETVLKQSLSPLTSDYDFIIIDSLPSLGMLFKNVITACTEVIIPCKAEYLDIAGVALLFKSGINVALYGTNPLLKVSGILVTMLNDRLKSSREVMSELQQASAAVGVPIFNTTITKGVKAVEASRKGVSIFSSAPKSKTALEYARLAKEVIALE